ncbi:c-type cytochrome [Inmirania thermothiophila]|uniref:Cbb3-type cytochrome c oxidase subunit III n=1 Tax=Inmirania thermothiophila TaxID=1750597 RepID=A0A3N1Y225_9GAMM|nr:cytochrome c [Inmirania thermothiophila]ROR32568.1 cbb3-type cytochrome c oxidase subunit III [Inmirania thermothiophila]
MKRGANRGARVAGIVFVVGLAAGAAMAGGGHGGGHGGAMAEGHGAMGGHAHDRWVDPPAEYAGRRWDRWDDAALAARGREIFQRNCAVCHGSDGRGTGPMAASLQHKPADLTRHFHGGTGTKGDAYLFWRVSEGGTVEPFRSSGSAMPAFKGMLSEAERWAVLTYVHQAFHRGRTAAAQEARGHGDGDGHS